MNLRLLVNNSVMDTDTVATEGQPWPVNKIEIQDSDGNVLTTGEEGTISATSPQVMRGYFNNKGRQPEP